MKARSTRIAAVFGAWVVLAAVTPAARAEYVAPVLASGSQTSQFTSATEPAITPDGSYVAFQGTYHGVEGVWRRDVSSGEIDLVAGGPTTALVATATGPSISADGQYVAFTTTADLTPAQLPGADLGCPEVYVRDMALAATDPSAYTLVAAVNGSSTGITFLACQSGPSGNSGQFQIAGAQAAPTVAISADGSEVAFTIDSPFYLGSGTALGAVQPASQVLVRDLDTDTTTVVSVSLAGQPTPGGGAWPSTQSEASGGALSESDAALGGSASSGERLPESTAAISADGSTVAWMGTNVDQQVASATDVTTGMAQVAAGRTDPSGWEVEPLWRRIADGASAQTVRLLAGTGLDFYDWSSIFPPAGVSFSILGGSVHSPPGAPALSADGTEAVVTASAPAAAEVPVLKANQSSLGSASDLARDLYLVDVDAGDVARVTPLTQVPSHLAAPAGGASVGQFAISPSGQYVAFDTARTQFALPIPSLITPPISYSGEAQTFVADLSAQTLELATSTYDGSSPNGGAGVLSLDTAGDVAVDSTATDLFYGNAVLTSPQTYLLGRVAPSTAVATETLSPAPTAPVSSIVSATAWTITATARARPDATADVAVQVPGGGTVTARASAQLASSATVSARTAIPFQTVGAATRTAARAATVRLVVRLHRADRRFATARHGLYAHLVIHFSSAGHAAVSQSLPITFRLRPGRASRHRATRPSRHRVARASRRGVRR